MSNKLRTFLFFFGLVAFALLGCNLPVAEPTPDFQSIVQTQAAATLIADMTEAAGPATATPPPSATSLPPATSPPTSTSLPATQVTRCNWAGYVTDVTIPDGTLVTPGAEFVKTWRLRNVGTCAWGAGYEFVFVDGNGLNAPVSIPLGVTVAPGETRDLSITFKAPANAGTFRGNWKLRSGDGVVFGIGGDANSVFWVEIKVRQPNANFLYDFAINVCAASWRSAAEDDLPCPGDEDSEDGYVILLDDVRLENRLENEPTLWVHADPNLNSWISGTYPAIAIQNGDRFRAWVGCLDGYDDCKVRFKLDYEADGGPVTTLAEWNEVYDEAITEINLDLSALAGKSVKFTLSMVITDGRPAEAQGFWFVPRLMRP